MQLTLTNAHHKSKARILSTYYNYDQLQTDYYDNTFVQKTLDTMDECAEFVMNLICAPSLSFLMQLDDAWRLIDAANVRFHNDDLLTYSARYNALSSNSTQYTLYVSVERDDFDYGIIKSHGLLCRHKPEHEMEYYDSKLQLWKEDEGRRELYDLLHGCTAERDFARMLEAYTGVTLMMSNEDAVMPLLENSRELIELSTLLDGLGRFQVIVITSKGIDFDDREAFPVIICSDKSRMGTAVYYRHGLYHLCQVVSIGQYDEPMILFNETEAEYKNKFCFEVDTAETAEELCPLLTEMWDRSSRHKLWLTIPISKRAYVNFLFGQSPDYNVNFVKVSEDTASSDDSSMELTPSESRNLKKMKSMLLKEL